MRGSVPNCELSTFVTEIKPEVATGPPCKAKCTSSPPTGILSHQGVDSRQRATFFASPHEDIEAPLSDEGKSIRLKLVES